MCFHRGKQTSVDLSCPRYLGPALSAGCVFVAASTGVETELFSLKGNDGTVVEYTDNKENRKGYVCFLTTHQPVIFSLSRFDTRL